MKFIFYALKSRNGQSIVEISLITPLLLIALYIPADFGIAFLVMNIAGTAARDGAALGSAIVKTGGTATDPDFDSAEADTVKDAVVARLPSFLQNRSITVRFYEDTPADCFEFIEVTASGNYSFFFYQLLRLFGYTVNNPVNLSRTTQMPYRNQNFTNSSKCTGGPAPFVYSNV
jgi:Flp pilus assembly protein TadG